MCGKWMEKPLAQLQRTPGSYVFIVAGWLAGWRTRMKVYPLMQYSKAIKITIWQSVWRFSSRKVCVCALCFVPDSFDCIASSQEKGSPYIHRHLSNHYPVALNANGGMSFFLFVFIRTKISVIFKHAKNHKSSSSTESVDGI